MKQVLHTEEQNTGSKYKVISLHCLIATKNTLKFLLLRTYTTWIKVMGHTSQSLNSGVFSLLLQTLVKD